MRGYALLLSMFISSACQKAAVSPEKALKPPAALSAASTVDHNAWQLIFSDEFTDQGNFDANKWSHCDRYETDWMRYITADPTYAHQTGGNLVLRMDNAVIAGDNVPYHSGAIETTGKFSFTYGKVEVRAKFNRGQGSWPAIWLMPETPTSYGDWPNSGEIDMMEHLNYDSLVYITVHNAIASGSNAAQATTPYKVNDFNTYVLEWSPTDLKFYIDGSLRFTYHKPDDATSDQWPYDKPFYIILNQAGGGEWPGDIDDADLPFQMEVDYVRVYKRPEFESGATYKIFSALNNTSLMDVDGAGTDDGASVILWPNSTPSDLNQQWRITNTGGGYYKLQPLHALSKALDVTGAGMNNKTRIQIYNDNGNPAQRWQIKSVGSDYYVLAPANAPSKQLEVAGGSTANGTSIQINARTTGSAQKFRFIKQ